MVLDSTSASSRRANQFCIGRVFLLGDAPTIHSSGGWPGRTPVSRRAISPGNRSRDPSARERIDSQDLRDGTHRLRTAHGFATTDRAFTGVNEPRNDARCCDCKWLPTRVSLSSSNLLRVPQPTHFFAPSHRPRSNYRGRVLSEAALARSAGVTAARRFRCGTVIGADKLYATDSIIDCRYTCMAKQRPAFARLRVPKDTENVYSHGGKNETNGLQRDASSWCPAGRVRCAGASTESEEAAQAIARI